MEQFSLEDKVLPCGDQALRMCGNSNRPTT